MTKPKKIASKNESSLATVTSVVRAKLATLSAELAGDIEPTRLVEVQTTVNDILDIGKSIAEMVKERVRSLVLEKGEKVTDAGTRRLQVEGWQLEVRPHRTGYDPKKVEGLLRAKNADLNFYMDAEIQYKVNASKLLRAVDKRVLTNAELEACRYDSTWTVQPPRRIASCEND